MSVHMCVCIYLFWETTDWLIWILISKQNTRRTERLQNAKVNINYSLKLLLLAFQAKLLRSCYRLVIYVFCSFFWFCLNNVYREPSWCGMHRRERDRKWNFGTPTIFLCFVYFIVVNKNVRPMSNSIQKYTQWTEICCKQQQLQSNCPCTLLSSRETKRHSISWLVVWYCGLKKN